jgi:hypothetical protein
MPNDVRGYWKGVCARKRRRSGSCRLWRGEAKLLLLLRTANGCRARLPTNLHVMARQAEEGEKEKGLAQVESGVN